MHFSKAIISLFALSGFAAAHNGDGGYSKLARREVARRDLTDAYNNLLEARDEYIEKRDLYLRGAGDGKRPPMPKVAEPPAKAPPKGKCQMSNDKLRCLYTGKRGLATYCGECPDKPGKGLLKKQTKKAKLDDPCQCKFYPSGSD